MTSDVKCPKTQGVHHTVQCGILNAVSKPALASNVFVPVGRTLGFTLLLTWLLKHLQNSVFLVSLYVVWKLLKGGPKYYTDTYVHFCSKAETSLINKTAIKTLSPGTDQSSKPAFGKSAFAITCFLLLKIELVHINRAKSKNAFEHVLARFSREHFARCTCQNVFESTFAFCKICVRQSFIIFNKRKHIRACFGKSAFA